MNKIIKLTGILVLAALAMSVPVLLGLSIGLGWPAYISLLLGLGAVSELTYLCIWMYFETEEA